MVTGAIIKKNEYHDSVFLMRVAKRVSEQRGITQAAALMGTEKNKIVLVEIGINEAEVLSATPNDLILAVKGENREAVDFVLKMVDQWLIPEEGNAGQTSYRRLDEALPHLPKANLAIISLPGEYAGKEAQRALEKGLNVFLFSNNVPLETELSLKQYARAHGLIVMGPDCGTAIVNGAGIGFANVIRQGSIGVVGASGTGMQEFTSLVHKAGSGISHAIGTGSNDLSDIIGGISIISAFEALESDNRTQVIAIISKPPGLKTLSRLIEWFEKSRKPVVACFLGLKEKISVSNPGFSQVSTLDEAAISAVRIATGQSPKAISIDSDEFDLLIAAEKAGMKPEQTYLRGLFAGGTFCYQTQQIFRDAGVKFHSNAPLKGIAPLPDPVASIGHSLVDMGADSFTDGRPHPMIDSTLRRERILTEAGDPKIAVLLLDFILGFNSAPDPVGDLVRAISEAKGIVLQRGGYLSVVASVCGTEKDPQNLEEQIRLLKETGAIVLPSSAQAALFAQKLVRSLSN
jgi:FdrA protein